MAQLDNETLYKDLAERMGEPRHLSSLESELHPSLYEPFAPGVIRDVSVNQDGVVVGLNYSNWEHLIEQEAGMNRLGRYESIEGAVRSLFYTNLEEVASKVHDGGYLEATDQDDTYEGIGLQFKLNFRNIDEQRKLGNLDISISESSRDNPVPREDFVQAYALHLKKAIKE